MQSLYNAFRLNKSELMYKLCGTSVKYKQSWLWILYEMNYFHASIVFGLRNCKHAFLMKYVIVLNAS